MLAETVSQALALRYNFSGKGANGKKGFLQLRLYKVVSCKSKLLLPKPAERIFYFFYGHLKTF